MLNPFAKDLLKKVKELYDLEFKNNNKDGFDYNHSTEMGHGFEHILGVIKRAAKISQEALKYMRIQDVPKNFDSMVACSAALHDIGNLVNRSGHNIYSGAFIRGDLKLSDIEIAATTSVPKQKGQLDTAIDYVVNFYLKSNIDKETADKLMYNERQRMLWCKSLALEMTRNGYVNYFDNKGFTVKTAIEPPELFEKINTVFTEAMLGHTEFIPREELNKIEEIKDILYKNLSPIEIEMIIDAVEDHNRDYKVLENGKEDKTQPSILQNIYGNIVFDADKDDCIETFIIRSYLFAMNELGKKNPIKFFNDDGTPNVDVVVDDIIAQMAGRFSLGTETLKRLNIENIEEIEKLIPMYAHPSCADEFKHWDFALKSPDNNILCHYQGKECEVKIEGGKYGLYDATGLDKEPYYIFKINERTNVPIWPKDADVYFTAKGGRDVNFKFPLPVLNKEELSERLSFYLNLTPLCDVNHYNEAYARIVDTINKTLAIGMTPEEAVRYYESPDNLDDVLENYDKYKSLISEVNVSYDGIQSAKQVDKSLRLPPLSNIIDAVYAGETGFNWEDIDRLYHVPKCVVIDMIRREILSNEVKCVEIAAVDKLSGFDTLCDEAENKFGSSFVGTFREYIKEGFEDYINSSQYKEMSTMDKILSVFRKDNEENKEENKEEKILTLSKHFER